MGESLKLESI